MRHNHSTKPLTENSAQLVRGGEAGKKRHSATLGETADDDAVAGNSLVHFLLDQAVEVFHAALDAGLVLGALVDVGEGEDVVPTGHAHAHVDSNGDRGGAREDEGDLFELVAAAPVLSEEHPAGTTVGMH